MKQKKVKLLPLLVAVLLFLVTVGTEPRMAYAAAAKPGKPILVRLENKVAGITIQWKKSSNAKGYYIYRKTENTSFKRIANIKNKNTISYTDKKVNPEEGSYIYTVRAYNGKILSDYDTDGLVISRIIPSPIELNKSSFILEVGKTYKLKATVTGASKKVTWSSSNTGAATVKNGTVTAKNPGTTIITAEANGKTDDCVVTVFKKKNNYKALFKKFLAQGKIQESYEEYYVPEYYYLFDADTEDPLLVVKGQLPLYPGGKPENMFMLYKIMDNSVNPWGSIPTLQFDGNLYFSQKYDSIYIREDDYRWVTYRLYPIHSKSVASAYSATNFLAQEYHISSPLLNINKVVSKSEYDKYFKKYFSGLTKFRMLKNTATNRAKSFS